MSWSIEERIGEFRPFPAQVVVYKGNTDECLAYVSGEVADRLKAENEKLREELAKWERLTDGIDLPECPVSQFVPKDLERENANLRKLVRELWNCALQYHRFDVYRHEIGVDGCGIDCTANGEGCCACKLEQRMRELGVEV